MGKAALGFAGAALNSMLASSDMRPQPVDDWSVPILAAAQRIGVRTVATAYPPIGPVRTHLDRAEPKLAEAGVSLHRVRRKYDSVAWPYAKSGFFTLKKKIPTILANLNLLR